LEQFAGLMQGLGYKAERGERPKVKPVDKVVPGADSPTTDDTTPGEDVPVMDRASDAPTGTSVDPDAVPAPADVPDGTGEIADTGVAPVLAEAAETPIVDEGAPAPVAENEGPIGTAPDAAIAGPEVEVFYTFTWGGFGARREGNRQGGKPGGREGAKPGGKPRGKGKAKGPRHAGGKPGQGGKAQSFQARPPKQKDRIDPDNPFAQALMGLKDKD